MEERKRDFPDNGGICNLCNITMTDKIILVEYDQEIVYDGLEGIATATFKIDQLKTLKGPVIVAFAPIKASENSRPAAIKIPQRFIEELTQLPIEVQGVPIQILIKLAHEIQKNKQERIICPS